MHARISAVVVELRTFFRKVAHRKRRRYDSVERILDAYQHIARVVSPSSTDLRKFKIKSKEEEAAVPLAVEETHPAK